MSRMHKHRLLPGYAGGTYEPANVLLCTIEEHANIHKTMWLFHGNREDYCAWKFLSGQMTAEELIPELELLRRQKISRAGKGRVCTVETRIKMSAANTPEVRALKSIAQKGRVVSIETRAKLSASQRGKTFNRGRVLGPLSICHRAKISAAKKGLPWSTARRLAEATRKVV